MVVNGFILNVIIDEKDSEKIRMLKEVGVDKARTLGVRSIVFAGY